MANYDRITDKGNIPFEDVVEFEEFHFQSLIERLLNLSKENNTVYTFSYETSFEPSVPYFTVFMRGGEWYIAEPEIIPPMFNEDELE